jgi:hypothetical protein
MKKPHLLPRIVTPDLPSNLTLLSRPKLKLQKVFVNLVDIKGVPEPIILDWAPKVPIVLSDDSFDPNEVISYMLYSWQLGSTNHGGSFFFSELAIIESGKIKNSSAACA